MAPEFIVILMIVISSGLCHDWSEVGTIGLKGRFIELIKILIYTFIFPN